MVETEDVVQTMINLDSIYEFGRAGEPDYAKALIQRAKAPIQRAKAPIQFAKVATI